MPGASRPATYISGHIALDAADVGTIAAGLQGERQVRAILLHELGHLIGLDQVEDPTQIMNPVASPAALDFADGDLTGLAALGRGACL